MGDWNGARLGAGPKPENITTLSTLATQTFQMEGRFRGFFRDVHGRHRMAMLHDGEEIFLKVPKLLRKSMQASLADGATVTVSGIVEYDHKADCDRPLVCRIEMGGNQCLSCPILVCTRKHCWNNGGREIWRHLKNEIAAAGMEDQVELKGVDCFGECKRGPNVKFAGECHHHCTPREAEEILEPLRGSCYPSGAENRTSTLQKT